MNNVTYREMETSPPNKFEHIYYTRPEFYKERRNNSMNMLTYIYKILISN